MSTARDQQHNTDTDTDEGTTDRPAGVVDPDANPPLTDPDNDEVLGGPGDLPPQDTAPAVPPYDGRKTSAD